MSKKYNSSLYSYPNCVVLGRYLKKHEKIWIFTKYFVYLQHYY